MQRQYFQIGDPPIHYLVRGGGLLMEFLKNNIRPPVP